MLVVAQQDWTWTFEQSIVPSSGSVTVTVYLTWSPNSKKPPFGGSVMVTVGRGVADRDRHVRRAGCGPRVGDRQLGGEVAAVV